MRLLALVVAVWLIAFVPTEVQADNVLHYSSDPDSIGEGREQTVTAAEGVSFSVAGYGQQGVEFEVNDHGNSYSLRLSAPTNSHLAVGDYAGATRMGGRTRPELEFIVVGLGSSSDSGEFQVLELAHDAAGQISALAVNFVLHGGGQAGAVYGEARYQSDVPYLTPAGVGNLSANHYDVIAADAANLVVKVSRKDGSSGPLAVDYATADVSCLAGRDYAATSGTVNWADGDLADKTFKVPILNTPGVSQSGTFQVRLGGAGVGAQQQAVVTVVNDPAATTFFSFQSAPGDPIGGGKKRFFSAANGYKFTVEQHAGGIFVYFTNTGAEGIADPEDWSLTLAPAEGATFGVGDYENADEVPDLYEGKPALEVGNSTVYPDVLAGSFQVLEAEFDASGRALKFAANVVQYANGSKAALYGQFRYNSAVPVPPAVDVSAANVAASTDGGAGGVHVDPDGGHGPTAHRGVHDEGHGGERAGLSDAQRDEEVQGGKERRAGAGVPGGPPPGRNRGEDGRGEDKAAAGGGLPGPRPGHRHRDDPAARLRAGGEQGPEPLRG